MLNETLPPPATPEPASEPQTEAPSETSQAEVPEKAAAVASEDTRTEEKKARRERSLRRMWTIGSVLSIALNVILCLVVLVVVNQLFVIKKLVGVELLGGLYANFVKMDQANIKTTIQVNDTIPIQFDLPISQDTQVVLSDDTYIEGARVSLNTGGLTIINAPTNIMLPKGTVLPVHLELVVPVEKTIPVTLNVPVDIPLDQTELHEPFTGLQAVVAPYYWMLKPEWKTCEDIPGIGALGSACRWIFWSP